jgi:ubiquinone/menaquinone biosynthesis C-methylase UbiE
MQKLSRRPRYGYDAPAIIKRYGIYSVLSLAGIVILAISVPANWMLWLVLLLMIFFTIFLSAPVITILLGSLYFKFRERDWLFEKLPLQGNEVVLDVGCGRGLLLIGAAKQLSTGKVHGLDLWIQADQASNSKEATLINAEIEGVQDKIEIHNGDMRCMPFADASMDVVVSSWAIHNIHDQSERETALAEIIRVLKPRGRLAILDIEHAPAYKDYFIKQKLLDVILLGPKYTFGNKTYLILAKKPGE